MSTATIEGFRLSPQQLGLWLAQSEGGASPYLVQRAAGLAGEVDAVRLARAVNAAVARHEILRTVFRWKPGVNTPLQVINDEQEVALDLRDLSGLAAAERERGLRDAAERDRGTPFDLTTGPLLRASLLRLSVREHVLLLTLPGLCGDLPSLRNLAAEVARLYESGGAGEAGGEDEIAQYADCAEILNELVESEEAAPGREFWRRRLEAAPAAPALPSEGEVREGEPFTPATREAELDAALARRLETCAAAHGVSLEALLLAGWRALLSRLTGEPVVGVGVAFDGRTDSHLDGAVGLFTKYLPSVGAVDEGQRFADLLRETAAELEEMAEWQDFFARVPGEAEGEGAAPPAFRFRFDDLGGARAGGPLGFDVAAEYECLGRCKLKATLRRVGGRLAAELQYDAGLYPNEEVGLLAARYEALLADAARRPGARVGELEVMGGVERDRVLVEWNRTREEFGDERLLHRLFETQAAATPGREALLFEDERLTYAELNERANRLAHHLRAGGVGPDVPVGVLMERSVGMVVGLLAVLKAGGAYVPLDPSLPEGRISMMLEDARVALVLTTPVARASMPEGEGARLVCLEDEREAIAARDAENPGGFGVTPDNLAYVIYTSGSTGRPKGVAVPHGAICNHMLWMRGALPLAADDVVLQKTPFTFDASVWEFFLPLMTGARLVVAAPGGHQDGAYLARTVVERGVTVLQLVPTMLRHMLAETDVAACRSLRLVACGGEALTADLREHFFETLDAELVNLYGPTEASIDATVWRCRPDEKGTVVPIGRPVSNMRCYILNRHLSPSPAGVAGELYLAGDGLARGYLRRPALTAERFVPDPFSEEPGARLYRTGDRCRQAEDGRIEYLGRVDNQVKLRGFRIELGEVEAALREHESVGECVAVVREDRPGVVSLVAYVVAARGAAAPGADELRTGLRRRLPEYMVPAYIVTLERLPLTHSGKLDRRALPAPDSAPGAAEYVAPRTPVEEVLAGIWAEVLRTDRVGARDDFFDLGGHSLLATQVVARARDAFGVEMSLRDFFNAPTLSGQAAFIEAGVKSAHRLDLPPLAPARRDEPLPLSSAQQRLWFLDQLEPGNASYVIPTAVRLRGPLNVAALAETFAAIVRRHESLRTTFAVGEDGAPVQVISEAFDPPLRVVDLGAEPAARREEEALRRVREESQRPFDLSTGPLMRLLLLRLTDEDHVLLCATHHIVSDIWSKAVLIREVTELYSALSRGARASLPGLPVQYADYAAWERELIRRGTLAAEAEYWKQKLAGAPPVTTLPADRTRPHAATLRGGREGVALPIELLESLRALSRREGATMFMTLLAAFNVVLLRYTGQEDLVVGTPIANRDRLEIENLIGFFANTLALRTDLSGNPTFRELLRRVREASLDAYVHRDLPFEALVEEVQPERNLGHAPLFQVMFIHQLAPRDSLELPGLTLERIDAATGTSKYDLSLYVVERPDSWAVSAEYSTDLFDAETTRRLLGHLRAVLDAMADEPGRGVWDLPLLTDEERRLFARWNDTRADRPGDGCIHQLFEEQAAATPDAVALLRGPERLSYRELNGRANRLARRLRRLGAGAETLVGVCVDRSFEMVVALLGVLKAGAAWVPLDPDYPRERLAYMVEDSGLSIIITESRHAEVLPAEGDGLRLVRLDAERDAVAAESGEDLGLPAAAERLAYLTYTSGSTGKPKGVLCLHGGAVNRFRWMWERFPFEEGEVCCQKTSLNFVDAVWEIFGPLLRGTPSVIIPNDALLDAEQLASHLEEGGVTRIVLVPSLLQHLLEGASDLATRLRRLKLCVCSGEALTGALARTFRETLPGCALLNLYGASEASADSLFHVADGADTRAPVPLGRPMSNTQVFIFDPQGRPAPVGVAGEIYLGGAGLARGYWRRAALTAERFVPHPSGEAGARLYRTGDLGRFLPDGQIEFLGRADHQVKLLGRRVELGEVEAALLAHESVRAAVVMLDERGRDKRLVAYVVPREGLVLAPRELRQYLRGELPDYMVPSGVVVLGELPLLPSGKLNRHALRALDAAPREAEGEYVAPRTPVEEVLAGIWADVLGVERVGMTDDFFDLGGHSLLLTRVAARVGEAFGVKPPLRRLFEQPSAEGLARAIELEVRAGQGVLPPPIGRAARGGPLPLSFTQERVLGIAEREGRPSVYNLEVGLAGPLDARALESSLNEVVRRNEALRTTFETREGGPVQLVREHEPFALGLLDLTNLPAEERRAAAARASAEQAKEPFVLSRPPLLRLTLVRLAEESHLLLVTVPHVVCDHISIGLFASEVGAVYAAAREGRASPLAEPPIQYPDFAYWERRWLRGEVYEAEAAYWRRQLAGCPPVLRLPTDHPRPAVKTYRGAQHPVAFDAALAESVARLARREKATVFMTLLAAFKAMLYRHTGQDDMVVGTAVAGRSQPGVEKLIGSFSKALPLRTRPSGEMTFAGLLAQVREVSLEAYAHEDMPFDHIVEGLDLEHDPSYTPLVQVGFVAHVIEEQAAPAAAPGGLAISVSSTESGRSVYDLTVRLYHAPTGLVGTFEYNTDLFERETVGRMVGHYGELLAAVAADPGLRLAELPPPPGSSEAGGAPAPKSKEAAGEG